MLWMLSTSALRLGRDLSLARPTLVMFQRKLYFIFHVSFIDILQREHHSLQVTKLHHRRQDAQHPKAPEPCPSTNRSKHRQVVLHLWCCCLSGSQAEHSTQEGDQKHGLSVHNKDSHYHNCHATLNADDTSLHVAVPYVSYSCDRLPNHYPRLTMRISKVLEMRRVRSRI